MTTPDIAEVMKGSPLAKAPSTVRKAIFAELRVTDEATQQAVVRSLEKFINTYRYLRIATDESDLAGAIRWNADTLSHVRQLSTLLQNIPAGFDFTCGPELRELRERLPKIEEKLSRFAGGRRRGRPAKQRNADHVLIGMLEHLYCRTTGKSKGSASRHNDPHGGEKHGRGGPFPRLVSMAFMLAGYPRGDAAVILAIQHYHRRPGAKKTT
jgi:hypothetical protein